MSEATQRTAAVLEEVAAERARQRQLWGEQTLDNGTAVEAWDEIERDDARRRCDRATLAGRLTWRLVLEEEVAEVLAEADPAALRVELLQLAAVAVQWVEALDRAPPVE